MNRAERRPLRFRICFVCPAALNLFGIHLLRFPSLRSSEVQEHSLWVDDWAKVTRSGAALRHTYASPRNFRRSTAVRHKWNPQSNETETKLSARYFILSGSRRYWGNLIDLLGLRRSFLRIRVQSLTPANSIGIIRPSSISGLNPFAQWEFNDSVPAIDWSDPLISSTLPLKRHIVSF